MTTFSASGLGFLAFPALLLLYYLICWLLFGNHQKIRNVAPQYDPPGGISPGVARYILTGGSDGTTLAAILAQLAAKGIITIEPHETGYSVRLLKMNDPVLPEEAAVLKVTLNASAPVQLYAMSKTAKSAAATAGGKSALQTSRTGDGNGDRGPGAPGTVVINPKAQPQIASVLNAVQEAFRENLEGVYFRWHWGCWGLGLLATFLWGMINAVLLGPTGIPSIFLTLWLFLFSSIAGLVFSGVMTSRPTRPTLAQRLQVVIIPLLFFVMPGFLIAHFAMPSAQTFVLALLLAVVLNSTFLVLLRAPTAEGRLVLERLAGFREFLIRVEQDRLDRMNTPAQRAELMDRFLPYAIALGVKEGWGDTMASAFSNAIVER